MQSSSAETNAFMKPCVSSVAKVRGTIVEHGMQLMHREDADVAEAPLHRAALRYHFNAASRNYCRPYSTRGISMSVSLMRLNVFVKVIIAIASEISASCVSVYPAARIAANSCWLIVPLVFCRVVTK